jgi:hypothetical protein
MILPGNPDAWPARVLDEECEDDEGFITDWVRPFAPDGATQGARDAAIRQLRDLLGDDYTEREGLAFMAGAITMAHRMLNDCVASQNAGHYNVELESVYDTVVYRTVGLVSAAHEAYDEAHAPDLTTLEEMISDD